MRLPDSAHTSRPWRIHELTSGFRLEDVWALPTPGGPDDFARLVRLIAAGGLAQGSSRAARALFAIRWKVGALLGWDDPDRGRGRPGPAAGRERSVLRDRLPADLRAAPAGPGFGALPFASLYLTGDEWAAEIINRTVHGVMHIGWVPDQAGGYRGQMAVYVKPNGLLGTGYMAAIAPFRHLIVYPPMLREIGRRWGSLPGERVRQATLPPSARALSTFSRIGYHDAFLVETGPDHDRTAEQWARAMLEQAPVSTRNALARGWSMLGLRLGPARSDQCVLGWEIRRATPDTVLLGARGRLGLSGELLVTRQQGALLFATFVRLDNALARTLWAAIAPRHRRVVRHLLERVVA